MVEEKSNEESKIEQIREQYYQEGEGIIIHKDIKVAEFERVFLNRPMKFEEKDIDSDKPFGELNKELMSGIIIKGKFLPTEFEKYYIGSEVADVYSRNNLCFQDTMKLKTSDGNEITLINIVFKNLKLNINVLLVDKVEFSGIVSKED